MLDGQLAGVYTCHTDAHEFMKRHQHKEIFYCPANSDEVSLWSKSYEGPDMRVVEK